MSEIELTKEEELTILKYRLAQLEAQQPKQIETPKPNKFHAAILSFLVPGTGQLYKRQYIFGGLIILAYLFFLAVSLDPLVHDGFTPLEFCLCIDIFAVISAVLI